jgi:hypothetical protein
VKRSRLLSLLVLFAFAAMRAGAEDKPVTFERDIAPLIEARCLKCHGGEKLEGGLDLRRRSLIEKGGDSGAAMVPAKPDESLLIQKVEKGEMPPKEEGALDQKQKDLFRRWIAAGAPLAGEKEQPLDDAEPPSRVTAEDRKFWSFKPPVRPPLPSVQNADRVRRPIDAFLLEKLEAKSISFADDAPKEVLLRRAMFALTGLPPTFEDQAAFAADERPDAFERLIDRLLASPQFGEHIARQWLDVAGYADSDGYLAADRLRPQAWRYRDYVIQSLNADLPYDQFVLEQLAGDELSDWRRADEITPLMARQLAATGFLRTASDPTYPGYIEPNEVHQVIADTQQIVSTSLLGITMQCCRCHAHKYDPIPQRDYYALAAVFFPALDPAKWQPSEVRGIPLASESQQQRLNERNGQIDSRVGQLNKELLELAIRFQLKRVAQLVSAREGEAPAEPARAELVKKVAEAINAAADKRTEEQKALVAKYAPNIAIGDKELAAWSTEYAERSAKLKAAVASETALKEQAVLVRGFIDLDDKPNPCKLLIRGDHSKPGAEVQPDVPEILSAEDFQLAATPGYKTTGRRTAFARWVTDPQNPLTARVHVNRVWAKVFGRGIVPTVANFGRSGEKPSHPELLDWLAREFADTGWGQKRLYRELLASSAWRQSSKASPAAIAADPDFELHAWWRAQRHTGEMLRDSVLAISGKLNGHMFGSPTTVSAQGDGSVTVADTAEGNRRSIYLQVRRSQHVTMLDLFDVPMMEINCPERTEANVPLSALAMLHSPFSEQSAAAFADRVLRETPADDASRIDLAFRLAFARQSTAKEQQVLQEFLDHIMKEKLGDIAATAASGPRQEAERAAWTQAALVLLNSNEFLYVH